MLVSPFSCFCYHAVKSVPGCKVARVGLSLSHSHPDSDVAASSVVHGRSRNNLFLKRETSCPAMATCMRYILSHPSRRQPTKNIIIFVANHETRGMPFQLSLFFTSWFRGLRAEDREVRHGHVEGTFTENDGIQKQRGLSPLHVSLKPQVYMDQSAYGRGWIPAFCRVPLRA